MKNRILANYQDKLVQQTANTLTTGAKNSAEKYEKIFYYVRDSIKFGFPKNGDLTTASQTIQLGIGQCNTKSTLFLALCKAVALPARIHFSLIKKEIQQGVFPNWVYNRFPEFISHSWVEVKVDNKWKKIDSFINDKEFYLSGKALLKAKGLKTGYSVSCESGSSSIEFDLEKDKFVQMDAVIDDHGVWDEPMDYYNSDKYQNRPSRFKLFLYRLVVKSVNRRVARIRNFDSTCSSGLCASQKQ